MGPRKSLGAPRGTSDGPDIGGEDGEEGGDEAHFGPARDGVSQADERGGVGDAVGHIVVEFAEGGKSCRADSDHAVEHVGEEAELNEPRRGGEEQSSGERRGVGRGCEGDAGEDARDHPEHGDRVRCDSGAGQGRGKFDEHRKVAGCDGATVGGLIGHSVRLHLTRYAFR
jgi:hypothetical protein